MKIKLDIDRPDHVSYSRTKDPIILFTSFDRQDDNRFKSDMHNVINKLVVNKLKVTPKNIAIHSGYGMREIELNLYEIEQIMDALDV